MTAYSISSIYPQEPQSRRDVAWHGGMTSREEDQLEGKVELGRYIWMLNSDSHISKTVID